MPLNPMPSIPGTQSESGITPSKPANNDRWGKFGVKNPSAPKAREEPDDAPSYAKGGDVKACSYAQGGPVLGRARDFMKEPSPFRDDQDFPPGKRNTMPEDQAYEKSGKGAPGKDKSAVKTPMPRK